jgi:hypothetical protein
MSRYLHNFLTVCLCLLSASSILLIFPSFAFAAVNPGDPTVVIAKASYLNPSACSITIVIPKGASYITRHEACLPVVQVETLHVLLSQALAAHEAYVTLPPKDASQVVLKKTSQQIFSLMHAVGDPLRPVLPKIPSSCNTSCRVAGVQWNPFGNTVSNNIYYNPSSDCTTVFLDVDYLTGQKSVSAIYWDRDQDSYGSWGAGCPFIGTTQHTVHPDASESSNTYYQPYVSDASNYNYFSNEQYINIALPVH